MELSDAKHVTVIGSGLAGLAAARDLMRGGQRVTLLEASSDWGGLASSLQIEDHWVERFYHFVCRPDDALIRLSGELGLADQLQWTHTRTSFFYNDHLYSFGTPFDLLRFTAIPWMQRLRFGVHILASRYRSHWRWLDLIPAKPWLIENIGEQAYHVIWEPLLQVKFGAFAGEISAAWMWHRIWRVARSRRSLLEPEMFGYFKGGSAQLVQALLAELQASPNVDLQPGKPVHSIRVQDGKVSAVEAGGEVFETDAVLSTVALPTLEGLLPPQEGAYFQKLHQIRYIGVVCLVMRLDRSFSPNFWLNIHDPRIAFNGIIEYTNLNRHLRASGEHILYIPFYLPTSEERYRRPDAELLEEYITALRWVNPQFERAWIRDWWVFRSPHAQAVCGTNFTESIPAIRSPLNGLYLTDSTQFYPEDRTLSAAIRVGREAAGLILQDLAAC